MFLSAKNLSKFAIPAALAVLSFSHVAVAQVATPGETPALNQRALPALAEGETVTAFLQRVLNEAPQSLAPLTASLVREVPDRLYELVTLALDANTSPTLASEVLKGLSATAAADPVAMARQVGTVAAANAEATASLISAARESNSIPLAEVFGEGLALAANVARTSGNTVLAALIQTQGTARDVPIALSEAFLDNMEGTAAGAEGSGGAGGGGGDIASNSNGDALGGGVGSASEAGSDGTAQSAGTSAPTGRSTTTTSFQANGTTSETSATVSSTL